MNDKKFEEYVEFTQKTAMSVIVDVFGKAAENKLMPQEALSVFQSCIIISVKFVADGLVRMNQSVEARSIINHTIEALPEMKKELEKMLEELK